MRPSIVAVRCSSVFLSQVDCTEGVGHSSIDDGYHENSYHYRVVSQYLSGDYRGLVCNSVVFIRHSAAETVSKCVAIQI